MINTEKSELNSATITRETAQTAEHVLHIRENSGIDDSRTGGPETIGFRKEGDV